MKLFKHLFLIAAIVSANSLVAQNWSLINPNLKYNYNLDVIGQIESTLFADSFQVNGSDTTFFLNRIIAACDTCTTPGVDYFLNNQPQFLQRQVVVSDGVYHFSDPWEFIIKPHAQLNDSWQFDTLYNYTATLTDAGAAVIFNEADSFKIISLPNAGHIVLSKKFGILQFPDLTGNKIFSLKGVKGPNVGTMVPSFYTFFNFNVGDVFQYEISEVQFVPTFIIQSQFKKVSILTKSFNQGVFSYQAKVQTKSWTDAFKATNVEFTYEEYIDTLVYADSSTHICNAYNHKAIANFNMIDPTLQPDSIMFGRINCFTGSDGLWVKGMEFSPALVGSSKQIFYSSQYDDPGLHPDLLTPALYNNFTYLFKAGFGEMEFSWVLPDRDFSRALIGYIKNGDTTGIVYNDLSYLSMDRLTDYKTGVSVYPNPVSEYAHVSLNNPSAFIDELRLCDLHGQLIRIEKSIGSNTYRLERNSLQLGCYLLQISDNTGKLYRQKLIVAE